MQPRIPRQSDREPQERSGRSADSDARLSAELAAAVAGARRRVLRDGDRQIDTAHLLHSLLESDAEVRAVFGEGPGIARLLGYLVQRSIGYGLRWRGGVEDSGGIPVVTEAEGFSPLAAACMEHARERARRRGEAVARGVDLLAALVTDPQARAVEVLQRAGLDPRDVHTRVETLDGPDRQVEASPGGGWPVGRQDPASW
ncbi:peptidase [Streptomyces sp. SBST2-5]|uniref:Peptidase n=1 Tax=Streptomyces composti TaxID=2720025 RepID=A0ABX1ACG9_9ACTN|nr:Clp protease N-terminal domain-containing protein [Streptomyces composti]NJP52151.1 peptidase [Streptomyces composti]